MQSDNIEVSVETPHGWLIPPEWEFVTEECLCTRQSVNLEEFLQVARNNLYHESKILALGLEVSIEVVDATIRHPELRQRLAKAIQGGAVPRSESDPPTDVDTFPEQVKEQESAEASPQD